MRPQVVRFDMFSVFFEYTGGNYLVKRSLLFQLKARYYELIDIFVNRYRVNVV